MSKWKQLSEELDQDPLGKYAFPQGRKLRNSVPYEKNTKLEDELEDAIENHFMASWPFTKDVANKLSELLVKGLYTDILKRPETNVVYRGMSVSEQWIKRSLELDDDQVPTMIEIEKRFTFLPKPMMGSSSWTSDFGVARDFSISSIEKSKYLSHNSTHGKITHSIVLHAKLSENYNSFLSGEDGLYKLQHAFGFQSEKEILGLNDIKVFKLSCYLINKSKRL
jgi:hypothetical protein